MIIAANGPWVREPPVLLRSPYPQCGAEENDEKIRKMAV
jgi:hypothetical protein